ncbi:hypothetical protein K8R20_00980 [bacterium]|nr:hypothetical protein [bacterium]
MTESKTESGGLSRRDAINVGILAASAIAAGCVRKSLVGEGLPPTSTIPSTLTPTETPVTPTETPVTPTETPDAPTPTPTETVTPSETPDVWELSLSERIELMGDLEFFTKLWGENTRKILTFQLDPEEYLRHPRTLDSDNCCGLATIATAIKMCEYLNTSKVPDITIADIHIALEGKTFTDIRGYTAKYVAWNDAMYFVGLPDALKTLAPQLISKTEFLAPNYGARYTRIVPQSEWPDIFSRAQAVCEDGGFVIIGGMKYRAGHIMLGTDIKEDGTATIVEPRCRIAQRVLLKDYFEKWVDPRAASLGRQPGLLHMMGITPKLNVSS